MLTDARDKGHPADIRRLVKRTGSSTWASAAPNLKLYAEAIVEYRRVSGWTYQGVPHNPRRPRSADRARTHRVRTLRQNFPPLGRSNSISARVPEVTESR